MMDRMAVAMALGVCLLNLNALRRLDRQLYSEKSLLHLKIS